ncbi:hypothetical protein DFP72DRAFT_1065109 [Ephemerocybe angulata]|uniref:Uncharacterized protein n=1 Tax=Ephemerocybe angulata TaxID=980116 RepID=A0A8H6I3Z2_9AGAR|nr:hypothetical protein DFP72DRAFT_1065109 [Tulosesus angulatus]
MLDHMAVQEHPEARAVFQLVRISSRLALWSFSQDEHSAGFAPLKDVFVPIRRPDEIVGHRRAPSDVAAAERSEAAQRAVRWAPLLVGLKRFRKDQKAKEGALQRQQDQEAKGDALRHRQEDSSEVSDSAAE